MKTKRVKFCDVPTGKQFKYDGRVYLKLGLNLASDENRTRVMFPSETEVLCNWAIAPEGKDPSEKPAEKPNSHCRCEPP
jgi:hypothetical protein